MNPTHIYYYLPVNSTCNVSIGYNYPTAYCPDLYDISGIQSYNSPCTLGKYVMFVNFNMSYLLMLLF